jgi:hypothetical protein
MRLLLLLYMLLLLLLLYMLLLLLLLYMLLLLLLLYTHCIYVCAYSYYSICASHAVSTLYAPRQYLYFCTSKASKLFVLLY